MTGTQDSGRPEGGDDATEARQNPPEQDSAQETAADQKVADQGVTDQGVTDQEDSPQTDSAQEGAAPEDSAQSDSAQEDSAEQEGSADEDKPAEAQDSGSKRTLSERTKGVLIGAGGAAVLVIVLLLAAFAWPGFLAGPGKPDSKATEVAAAWSSKKAGELENVSCSTPAGKMAQYPPQMMQMVQAAKQSGPVQQTLDTEATMPLDLTVQARGQTQTLPANVLLGVTDNEWCMKGLQPRK